MTVVELPVDRKTRQAAKAVIEAAVSELLTPSQITLLRRSRRIDWPRKAGVYGIYRRNRLIYVGESGNLHKRACDLFRTVNHQFRRTLGAEQYSRRPDYEPASSKRRFCPAIEEMLTEYMERHLRYVAIPIDFGRKEIEEAVCARLPALMNRRQRRV